MSAIAALTVFLRVYGIMEQALLADEIQVAFSAVNFMENGQLGPTMAYHPNLRNIVQYWIGGHFGFGLFSLRAVSLFCGILSVPLVGIILYEATKNRLASHFTSFLLAVDQVHITFSRQAIQESWTTFFFLLGVLLFVKYIKRERVGMLLLSGIAFGLGTASKFHTLFPMLVCLGWGVYFSWKERSTEKFFIVCCTLTLVPATVYLLTFIPWFARGYGMLEWIAMQKVLLAKMTTHQGNPMDQLIDTSASLWFLRPMGYANFTWRDGQPFVTVAYSNPFVWMLVLPATVKVAWGLVRRKFAGEEGRGKLFVLLLFAVSYLPLALSPRPIWLLSSLATLPFALMVLALAVSDIAEEIKGRSPLLLGYVAIVMASSAYLYPMAVGKGKFYNYLDPIVQKFDHSAHETDR